MNSAPSAFLRGLALAASLVACTAASYAQVSLADQPVFTSVSVPGNLALTLSVEFPTAISVAHPSRTYSSANTYVGYFDPAKCYAYRYTDGTSTDNYFYPNGLATNRTCSGAWSGNYLNWASMQTVDPFRWALTGGYRVIDTSSLTVLEKAWGTNQGSTSNFPDSSVAGSAAIAGATPFSGTAGISTRIWSLGNKMRFMTSTTVVPAPNYSNAATHYNPGAAYVHGTLYEVFIRVKVCDSSGSAGSLEDNCTRFNGSTYKPMGLLQKYSDKIRYSAFGYLNDSNLSRDGGVLRARQKFIGPTMPVPGGIPVNNPKSEWDATTGVMATNPDASDATDTNNAFGITISNSGVMNYLNKFGQISPGSYKTYDPVGELYYAAQRYFRNLGNVSSWTSMSGADTATKTTWADGFPVITSWGDPIQYSCQRNFILGIGDVNTHADRNLPGTTGNSEPARPTEVTADTGVDSLDWTNKVGVLQSLGTSLGSVQGYNGCCNNNGALMAGLAYWSNVNDIRSDLAGKQTIQTYWLDVLEYGAYKSNNQFYLAAKYGGFAVPDNYSASAATSAQFGNTASTKFWWATSNDTVPDGAPRPDNYYTAAQADQMVAGLTKAFSSIASKVSAYSTSFSTALPQVSALGVASYSTKYDAKSWSGELTGSNTTFDATGRPTLTPQWSFTNTLAAQANGTGWDTARNIVTYNTTTNLGVRFRTGTISTSQLSALNTTYVSGDDSTNYLNYLRGDRSNERSSTAVGSTNAYRDRLNLVGDVVNAKVRPVGVPAFPYSDGTNPGYSTFKTTYSSRTQMVYVNANDGMVHAVNGSLTGTDAGKEVWAYVPAATFNGPTGTPSVNGLASLGNTDFVHHFLVDATPVMADLDFGRTPGGNGTADWRTILVGGLGKGGKAIYGLDITDPSSITSEATAAQKVLWEFTDTDLGYVYGQPQVVKTTKYGWVVVAASGYNNANGRGYFFFINPRTGSLLEKIAIPCSACSSSNQAGMAHVNAFVLDITDGRADAIYAGDLMGNVWRLDVTGSAAYPTPVKFAYLTGSDSNPLPITTKVLPVVQPGTNRRYLAIGTGRMLDASDLNSTQAQRFFALLDGNNAVFSNDGTISGTTSDLPTGITFPLTVSNMRELTDPNTGISLDLRSELGWYLDLGASAGGPGWRVLTDPSSFYGTVAFASTSPSSGDACSPGGTSRIYSIDLGSGYCALASGNSSCYVTPLTGVVIDLAYLSVNGKLTLVAGSNSTSEGPTPVGVRPPNNLGLQRLNWREIQTN